MKRLALITLVNLLFSPMAANALTPGGFGLRPQDPTQAYFHYIAKSGEVSQDALTAVITGFSKGYRINGVVATSYIYFFRERSA